MATVDIRDIPQDCYPPSVRAGFADFTAAEADDPRAGDIYEIAGNKYHWNGSSWVEFSGDKTYQHDQAVASAIWVITHSLNKYPSVTVLDSSDRVVVGDVRHLSNNVVEITFSSAFAGSATLN